MNIKPLTTLLAAAACAAVTTAFFQPLNAARVGQRAPALDVDAIVQGAESTDAFSLDEYDGKAVIVEFWGTWCGPCVKAIPHWNEVVAHFQDSQDVVFITISNEDKDTLSKFFAKTQMLGIAGSDPDGSCSNAYGITGYPTTVFIDPDGRIAKVGHPMQDLTIRTVDKLIDGDRI